MLPAPIELMIGTPALLRPDRQFHLGADRIDGVNHIIILAKIKLIGRLRPKKDPSGVYDGLRIDGSDRRAKASTLYSPIVS